MSMTRQQAEELLTTSLTRVISKWLDDAQSNELETARMEFGWIGDDLHRLMARSAMATWAASVDVQDYLKREGHLQD